jgi:hypothetical protein
MIGVSKNCHSECLIEEKHESEEQKGKIFIFAFLFIEKNTVALGDL